MKLPAEKDQLQNDLDFTSDTNRNIDFAMQLQNSQEGGDLRTDTLNSKFFQMQTRDFGRHSILTAMISNINAASSIVPAQTQIIREEASNRTKYIDDMNENDMEK